MMMMMIVAVRRFVSVFLLNAYNTTPDRSIKRRVVVVCVVSLLVVSYFITVVVSYFITVR